MTLDTISSRVESLQHEAYATKRRLEQERQAFRLAQRSLKDAEHIRAKVQVVAQAIQQQAHTRIAGVVTTCLRTVFGENSYEFRIKFVQKRGKTEALLILMRDGQEIADPINEDSGGVVQIAAFALRLACLVLARPRLRRLLVLDEPFPHVSALYRPAVRQMLKQLSQDFDVQFVIVTHEDQYKQGKVMQL